LLATCNSSLLSACLSNFIVLLNKKNGGTMTMLNFVVVRQRKILRSSDPDNSYYRYFWFVKVCESACEYLGQKRETKS
jgi:uncharacterized membrane protein